MLVHRIDIREVQARFDLTGNGDSLWSAARALGDVPWRVTLTTTMSVPMPLTSHKCMYDHNDTRPQCLQNLIKRVYKVYTFLPALAGHGSLWSAARRLGDGEWAVT